MTETTLIKNHIKSDPNTADRWRILAEGMTTITATTDRISLATCVETVIQDMFNTVKCLILLIDRSTHDIIFDSRGQTHYSGNIPPDGTELCNWIDRRNTPEVVQEVGQEDWPDIVSHSDLSKAMSALLISEPMDRQYLVITLVLSDTYFDDVDLDLGVALTRHIGIAVKKMIEYEKKTNDIIRKSQHLEQELELAGEIQRTLLPRSIPQVAGLSMSLISKPSREIGGDFYDMFTLADKYLGVAVGDVVGKGIPGAITMASLYTAFHEYATDPLMIPSDVMLRANDMLLDATASDRFATLFYGVVSLRDGLFRYCNAGHPPPLICRKNGTIDYLSTGGLILGSFSHARYENGRADLNEGDVLVLYTDGVTETTNDEEQVFGFKRLEQVIRQCKSSTVEEIKNSLTDSLHQFTDHSNIQDDITVIIVKCEQPFNRPKI